MKRIAFAYMFACVTMMMTTPAQSQVMVDIINNTSYTSNYVAYPTYYGYYNAFYVDQLYTASELIAMGAPAGGGKIPAIWLWPTYSYNYSGGPAPLTIKMAHTSATTTGTFWAYQPPLPQRMARWDETVVYENPAMASPTSSFQWWRIEFDQWFEWDGVSNLIVSYCYNIQSHVPYPNYHNYWYTRGGYPPNNNPVVDLTYWYGASTSYNLPPTDWCQNTPYDTPPLYTAPYYEGYRYSAYYLYRQDMRFEICDKDPLVFDMTVPPIHYLPGTLPVSYSVGRASDAFTTTVTVNLYQPNGTLVKTEVFQVPINADMKNGVYQYTMMNVPAGYYRLEAVFNGLDECGNFSDHFVSRAVMILDPGSTPCEVWPGDVNNNGLVNYGDRADLNTYIHEANLSQLWLAGPARFRVDQDMNPLTYYSWELQPAVPWYTAEGCYMDADGNGIVNNFDYIAIKMNWMRTHGIAPKEDAQATAYSAGFAMEQNYPNPFNPTTTIRYTLPERSAVRMVVTDMMGREVATLVDGNVEAGSHTADFDASTLSSGNYVARVMMTGIESGATFTNTIKMTLGK